MPFVNSYSLKSYSYDSFAGIGLGKGNPSKIELKVLKSKTSFERWLRCKVLIIDEISMMSKDLFELLDRIAKSVHNNDIPMGGIQVILVGDFLQLPPVQRGPLL